MTVRFIATKTLEVPADKMVIWDNETQSLVEDEYNELPAMYAEDDALRITELLNAGNTLKAAEYWSRNYTYIVQR